MDGVRPPDLPYTENLLNDTIDYDTIDYKTIEKIRKIRGIDNKNKKQKNIIHEDNKIENEEDELNKTLEISKMEYIKCEKEKHLKDILIKLSRLKSLEKDETSEIFEIYDILLNYKKNANDEIILQKKQFIMLNNYLCEIYEKPLKLNKKCYISKEDYQFIKNRLTLE